jgi:hypothetical protein
MCATVSWGAHESFMHPIFVLKNGCDKVLHQFGESRAILVDQIHRGAAGS